MNWSELSALFAPTDIEWRLQAVSNKNGPIRAKCVAYITNRAIMERLDLVCGPQNWKNEYREWGQGSPGVLCGISIRDGDQWITKWDGAEQTDIEPVKGGLSASMKRAAVQWGIGRYLYDLPQAWAKINENGEHYQKAKDGIPEFKWDNPDLPNWALPNGTAGVASDERAEPAGSRAVETPAQPAAVVNPDTAHQPTDKQVLFYQRLVSAPVFTEDERKRALDWLATKATRQTIKDQIDWLKRQVETRKPAGMPA